VTTRQALLTVVLSLLPLSAACGGGGDAPCALGDAACSAASGPGADAATTATGADASRGDDPKTPAWGGWAWGNVPAEAVARAGFDWFETGYPGDTRTNEILASGGVRPFAYINLGELHDDLRGASGYSGPILRTNGDWGTYLVDVTHPSWQDWLVRRADEAYRSGSRGVKWDVATPDVPPGKTRADVNDAMASVMQRILSQHPDLKFVFNQGFDFALAYPQFVHGVQTEGLFSASSAPGAWLQPWSDPWYWGPQFDQAKELQRRGIPIFIAEYADPFGQQAKDLYAAITAQGFVPYITSDHWDIRGWGLEVKPGW
jgi:polysaccharide biosynthesis protein PelA